jgi:hypothetical protein
VAHPQGIAVFYPFVHATAYDYAYRWLPQYPNLMSCCPVKFKYQFKYLAMHVVSYNER